MKFYRCENKDCAQGARGEHSYFSGGMTAAQKTMLTGEPEDAMTEGKDYGDGFCPTCGTKAKEDKEDRTPVEGTDS